MTDPPLCTIHLVTSKEKKIALMPIYRRADLSFMLGSFCRQKGGISLLLTGLGAVLPLNSILHVTSKENIVLMLIGRGRVFPVCFSFLSQVRCTLL